MSNREKLILGMACYLAVQDMHKGQDADLEKMKFLTAQIANSGYVFTKKALDRAEKELIKLGRLT